MKTQDLTKDTKGEIVIYQSEEGKAAIDVILQDETVWVTQEQMVALFGKAKSTISEHLKHIFEEGELDQNSVVRFFRTTAADGKSYNTAYYNLDVVISRPLLEGSGSISHQQAQEKAEHEYTIYRQREMNQLESDYDRAIRQLSLFGSTNSLLGEDDSQSDK